MKTPFSRSRATIARETLHFAISDDLVEALAPPSIHDMVRAAVLKALNARNEYLETALAEHLNAGVTIDRIELRVHSANGQYAAYTEIVVDGCPTHRVTIGSAHGIA